MATAIQRRRGTSAQHENFVGLAGEITIDTTHNTVVVHDGVTAGGVRLAKYTEVVAASSGDITAVVTADGSGLTGGTNSGTATLAIDYENMQGNLVPAVDNVYSLGTADRVWKDVFVGPGSLYVNGQKVLEDNAGTIVVGADEGQNLALNTKGGGDIEFNAIGGGTVTMKSNVVIATGFALSAADGSAVDFNSNINVKNNQINNVGAPLHAADAANKDYVDTVSSIVRTTGAQSIAGVKTFTDDVVVQGGLTVSGTVTTINSETIKLADNIIDLNSNFESGSPTENAGLRIMRGDASAVQIRWNEADDVWQYTNDGANYNDMITVSDVLNSISAAGDLTWDSSTGEMSYNAAVTSVAGKTGAITLTKTDVGLSNVDNTSDANKPVSTATQTALNLKADVTDAHLKGNVSFYEDTGTRVAMSWDASAESLSISKNNNGSPISVSGNTSGSNRVDVTVRDVTTNTTLHMMATGATYNNSGIGSGEAALYTRGNNLSLAADGGAIRLCTGTADYAKERLVINTEGKIQVTNGQPVWTGMAGGALIVSGGTPRYTQLAVVDSDGDVTHPVLTATAVGVSIDGELTVGGVAVQPTDHTVTSINKTLEVNEKCLVTVSGRTITLPASPSQGDQVGVVVENFSNTVIDRNGATIMELAENLTINKPYASIDFVYTSGSWRIV